MRRAGPVGAMSLAAALVVAAVAFAHAGSGTDQGGEDRRWEGRPGAAEVALAFPANAAVQAPAEPRRWVPSRPSRVSSLSGVVPALILADVAGPAWHYRYPRAQPAAVRPGAGPARRGPPAPLA